MLKKQTIWLLTMLSLMIVLSVYYMTSPEGDDFAYIDTNEEASETSETSGEVDGSDASQDGSETESAEETQTEEEDTVVSQASADELFTSIRMDIQDERSMARDRLEDIVASDSASTEEKNEAYDKMREMDQTATKESILEESILAEASYDDVLIRSDEEVVHVTVKADKLSETEANNIIRMVYDEFGDVEVDVKFQPVS